MSQVFLTRALSGFAGDITRPDATDVEAGVLNATTPPLAFGVPVKVVSGQFHRIAASDAATVFYGILARSVPSIAGDTAETFAAGTPNVRQVANIVRRGYVNVVCFGATVPGRGGAVHMYTTAANGRAVGDLVAAADGSNTVVLTGVTWAVDGRDANNIAEIRIV